MSNNPVPLIILPKLLESRPTLFCCSCLSQHNLFSGHWQEPLMVQSDPVFTASRGILEQKVIILLALKIYIYEEMDIQYGRVRI